MDDVVGTKRQAPTCTNDTITLPMFSGVVWRQGEWQVRVSHKGNKHYIGHEANEKDAALLYDKASIALAENPVLNFQENGRLNPERKRKVAACTMR
jgi:hypothetical protein